MICDATDTAETSIELLREFELTGDPAVFEVFMRRHASMVYATCLKVTRDPHDAEDATQATFLTLASKSKLNGEIRQPEAWLRKVAHRLSLDLIRSKKRRVNRENARSEMSDEAAPLDSHDHADHGEVKGILNEELAKLPASYRMPLVLHYFGGLSRDEMAAQLKLKPSTLGVRLHRAREQLRKRLANRGVVLPGVAMTALLAESVQFSISEKLVSATAHQASAILFGQATLASASPLSVSAAAWAPSAGFIAGVTDVIVRSKVKLVASVLVLGSALGAANAAEIARLVPAVVREWLPSLSLPRLPVPKFDPAIPMPKFSAKDAPAAEPAVAPVVVAVAPTAAARQVSNAVVDLAPAVPATPRVETLAATFSSVPVPAPVVLARIDVGLDDARPLPEPTRASSPRTSNTGPSAPRTGTSSSSNDSTVAAAPQAGSARTSNGQWGAILDDASVSAGAPAASDDGDLPETLVASVVGSSPLNSGGGGGGGGGGGSADAGRPNTGKTQVSSVAAPRGRESRTVVFAGVSANYGGYADDSWKQSAITDLSGTLAADGDALSFNQPVAPAQALSINGARVTLHGVDADANVEVSFLDTNSAAYPTLPGGHHFIGAWQLAASDSFDSADLLVRYDDLRAARLGLSEQILKLWVSDGTSWTLLWHDPTFGRDVNENLIWVTAGSGFKFFAVSAPEPGAVLVFTLSLLGACHRRRGRV